jgi:hypothetical protein
MKRRPHNNEAAVLVFAVLLLAAGVFVLTGIAQLSATQALIGQDEWATMERRVQLENSRSLARQFMLTRMFRGVVSTNISYTNTALGSFSLSPLNSSGTGDYWTTPSSADTNINLKINPFTLMERGGFYRVVVPGKISDGVMETDWNFQVRTRSPIAAGYSFVQQLPANNNLLGLVPSGVPYIDMRTSDKFFGYPLMPRMPVSSVTNTNAQDTNGYVGYLAVPLVPGGSSYGLFTNASYELRPGTTNALQIVLDLGAEDFNDTNSVVLFNLTDNSATFTNTNGVVFTNLPIQAMVLRGADTPTAKPLHVVVGPGITNTTVLVLANNNERLVYFNRQKQTNDGIPFDIVADPSAYYWRLGMTVSQSPVQFEIGTLEITGGLRTDNTMIFQGGEAYFVPETSPEGLDYIADRMMWLEDYKTP